jgi:hypothetical protein
MFVISVLTSESCHAGQKADALPRPRLKIRMREQAIICSCVVRETAELALVARGAWLGTGKWLLRELRAADPRLAEELLATREDPPRLAALAERVLARAVGRLWDGYRQVAAS